jgi:predicted ester cyclase
MAEKEFAMGTLRTPEKGSEAVGEVDIDIIARTVYEMFNLRRLDEAAHWVDDHCEWTDVASGTSFRGPDGFIAYESGWIRAFPDAEIEIINLLASGDLVATEFIGRGTHLGPLQTAARVIAPTGKEVQLRCIEVQQYSGAKIVRGRLYYDALTLLRQLEVSSGRPEHHEPFIEH